MADPTINLSEEPEMMTIDEVGKVVPASHAAKKDDDWVSWIVWCEACSKKIRGGLSSTIYAHSLAELHREENPDHPADCIKVMTHVCVEYEMFRV